MDTHREIAFCPHCGNNATQRHLKTYQRERPSDEAAYYTLVVCETCDEALLYRERRRVAVVPRDVFSPQPRFLGLSHQSLVWPRPRTLHPSIPDSVRTCYEEATAIKPHGPNAFAGQIRRSLEAVCRDRGMNENSLAKNLQKLVDVGEIPKRLGEMTEILRLLGNIGSHADRETIKPEYVEPIDEFFRAIVEYVYVAPHKVDEVKALLARASSP